MSVEPIEHFAKILTDGASNRSSTGAHVDLSSAGIVLEALVENARRKLEEGLGMGDRGDEREDGKDGEKDDGHAKACSAVRREGTSSPW